MKDAIASIHAFLIEETYFLKAVKGQDFSFDTFCYDLFGELSINNTDTEWPKAGNRSGIEASKLPRVAPYHSICYLTFSEWEKWISTDFLFSFRFLCFSVVWRLDSLRTWPEQDCLTLEVYFLFCFGLRTRLTKALLHLFINALFSIQIKMNKNTLHSLHLLNKIAFSAFTCNKKYQIRFATNFTRKNCSIFTFVLAALELHTLCCVDFAHNKISEK